MGTSTAPSQERSRRRRDAMLDAAIELLAEGGARAVTHRAVASRARLPAGSTTYYFDSIQQLTEEALARHVQNRVIEFERLTVGALESGRDAEAIAQAFSEALVEGEKGIVIALYEIYLEAARNPALRQPVLDALETFERLAANVVRMLGGRRPDEAAAAMIAIIDGFALHRVARRHDRGTEIAALVGAMRAVFVDNIMNDDERQAWTMRLRQITLDA